MKCQSPGMRSKAVHCAYQQEEPQNTLTSDLVLSENKEEVARYHRWAAQMALFFWDAAFVLQGVWWMSDLALSSVLPAKMLTVQRFL